MFTNKITDEHACNHQYFICRTVNPFTLMSDQDRGILVDLIPNSPNLHHKNCMANSKENYYYDLGIDGVK